MENQVWMNLNLNQNTFGNISVFLLSTQEKAVPGPSRLFASSVKSTLVDVQLQELKLIFMKMCRPDLRVDVCARHRLPIARTQCPLKAQAGPTAETTVLPARTAGLC
jgi:hypothetical protein